MKEILQSVIDAIDDLVFVKDRNLVYIGCNKSFCRFIDRSQDQIVGHTDDEWFDDPDVLDGFRSLDLKLFANGMQQRKEEWVSYPDGKSYLLDTIKYPLKDEADQIIALVGISRDITEKRSVETTLEEQHRKLEEAQQSILHQQKISDDHQQRLELALTGSHSGVLDWNLRNYHLYLSPQLKALLGYTENELPNKFSTWIRRVHPDDLKHIMVLIHSTFDNKNQYFKSIHRLQHKNGQWLWILAKAKVHYDCEGHAIRMIGTHTDITEEKTQQLKFAHQAQIIEQIHDSLITTDMSANIVSWNQGAENLFGYLASKVTGKHISILFPPEERAQIENYIIILLENGEHQIDVKMINRFQDIIFTSISLSLLKNENGKPINMIAYIQDITQRKKAEHALRISENRFRTVFERTDFISVQGYDQNHQVTYWNPASEQLYGYTSEQAIGRNIEELIIPGGMREQVKKSINNWINGGDPIPSAELRLRRSDGSSVDVFSSHVLFHNENNEPKMYCIDIDVSLLKQYEQKILHQAHYDALTELPNRFLSLDRLTHLLENAERKKELIAVLFLDLDDFKKINHTLGHEFGDKVLVETAKRLKNGIRAFDTVGRLGGDEFIILLCGLKQITDAHIIVKNLLNQFTNAFSIDRREIILGASIGIAIFPFDAKNSSELLRNADSAMFHAKKQGRNTYEFFTKDMKQNVSKRLAIEEQLYEALDKHELKVYYQPIINVAAKQIMGAEALLRWNNPKLGSISPEVFIPIAEQTGLIVKIGQFVIIEALKMTAYWQQKYCSEFNIAVNLSPRQFRDSNLDSFIEKELSRLTISNNCLELEVTENILISNHQYIIDVMTALKLLNVSISMDDFGMGYSSLSYLRKYPFDILKIDRSFVSDLMLGNENKELVKAIISMAHGLKLKVVAEGVETQEQLDFLKTLSCDYAQGYLFSKPVPAEKLSQLLKAQYQN